MLLNMVMFKVTICDLKNKDRNMADNIEHQDKGEQVANCDLLQNDEVVVTTPVESRIVSVSAMQPCPYFFISLPLLRE